MADWSTIASVGTAAGTLILAIATFSSVRSGQRSARVAERALLVGLRPVLVPSRHTDPAVSATFGDRRRLSVDGGMAGVESGDGVFYFVLPLRNVGSGLAVLHAWQVRVIRVSELRAGAALGRTATRPDPEDFRIQQLDLYVPAGDTGVWLGAVRDPTDQLRTVLQDALERGERVTLDLLYGDHEGGQRTISRFGLTQADDGRWGCAVMRHWSLEGADPRQD